MKLDSFQESKIEPQQKSFNNLKQINKLKKITQKATLFSEMKGVTQKRNRN